MANLEPLFTWIIVGLCASLSTGSIVGVVISSPLRTYQQMATAFIAATLTWALTSLVGGPIVSFLLAILILNQFVNQNRQQKADDRAANQGGQSPGQGGGNKRRGHLLAILILKVCDFWAPSRLAGSAVWLRHRPPRSHPPGHPLVPAGGARRLVYGVRGQRYCLQSPS
jgi:hypothetical protein